MGGDLIFTDNAGVSFSTSDGGAHTMFNDTDDVAKFTADNGDTFEFTQNETPNKNSSAVVVSANLYNALDMTLDSMGSALDGDAAYRVEAGDKIFNPDTCKIQRYNSTVGGFDDLCDPIEGKLYANKMTGYIYRWDTKTKKMVFVGGVKAYTKDEADSRFAKLKDETQTVNVKELNANNFVSAKSMWIGDEGLLLGGDGNGHLTVEQDEVITDVTLNEKLATKADDVAYMVDFNDTNNIEKTGTVKEATQSLVVVAGLLLLGDEQVKEELNSKIDKELHVVLASMGVTLDNVDNAGDSTIAYVANVGDIYYSEGKEHLFYKKSETLTIDLGEPNDKKIYANAITKRLYIWKGGTWRQCRTAPQETKESIEEKLGAWLEEDGGEADGEVYTKTESDARYLRGDWELINEVSEYDTSKNRITVAENCEGYKELAVRRMNSNNLTNTNVYLNIGGVSVSLQGLSSYTKDVVWHIVQDGNNLSVEFLYYNFANTGSRLNFPATKHEYRLNSKIGGKVELEFYTLKSLHSGENIKVYGKR